MAASGFSAVLKAHGLPDLRRSSPTTLQMNLGKRCNQACQHCHVDAGPTRTEAATPATIDRVIQLLSQSASIRTLDITGGAPELHPDFRRLVTSARDLNLHVMDRCNLTVLSEPGQEETAQFLADNMVEVVASLPCYSEANVNSQRGPGVFEASIQGLQELNSLGYGQPGTDLKLNLVYNPLGPALPPDQGELETAYKERLQDDFGVQFNALYTITNMPIARFKRILSATGELDNYIQLLTDNFNPASVPHLMCTSMLSVSWEGTVYDCDFNQMLKIKTPGVARNVWDITALDEVGGNPIATGSHCLGCTAGAGSSCGGALQ